MTIPTTRLPLTWVPTDGSRPFPSGGRRHPNSLCNRTRRPSAAEQLLPLVYEELRKLAAAKMAQEKPGQTLQATALVHEAYIRLVDVEKAQHWDSRGHFFAAAAEAMRRILVERLGRRDRCKRGGELAACRVGSMSSQTIECRPDVDLLALDEALEQLERR